MKRVWAFIIENQGGSGGLVTGGGAARSSEDPASAESDSGPVSVKRVMICSEHDERTESSKGHHVQLLPQQMPPQATEEREGERVKTEWKKVKIVGR
jgi:hypothetical protein